MARKMLGNMAYQAIKERIAKMPSGTYLSARQCALELDMSYTPVREAFLRLQEEGILRQVPNVGFFIQNVDLADLFQLFQVRECLEPFALDKVFGKLTAGHIEKMRQLCAQEEIARKNFDGYQYADLDSSFHRIPLELLGNKQLLTLYDNVRSKYQIISGQLLTLIDTDIQLEHQHFVDALERRDRGMAHQLLCSHIQEMKQRFITSYMDDHLV